MNQDYRTRFVFDGYPARGLHVKLEEVWQHIVQRKAYPIAIQRALGELLAAAALLSDNMKLKGTLIVQVQGTGVLKMLVAEAADGHTCRATARWDEHADIPDQADLASLLGKEGIFALTVQPQNGEPWQGIVPLEGDSIAQMLMNYMTRSEQLQTHIVLAADEQQVAGFLLQRMPEAVSDEEAWTQILMPAQTLTQHELLNLDTNNVLYRLFHETLPRVFPAESLEFACTCSRGKVADMLLLIGGEEVGKTVVAEGSITVDCDFCNEKYTFDENDVNALFGMDVVSAVKSEQMYLPVQ